MNIDHLLTVAATVITVTEGPPDDTGTVTQHTRETPTTCWLHPGAATEDTAGTDIQSGTATIYLPAGTVITGWDRIDVAGSIWEVTGPPWAHLSPLDGTEVLVQATIRRTT